MPRILHLADLHLSQRATLAHDIRTYPGGMNMLLADTLAAVAGVAESARSLDGVVIAGDLFDHPEPTNTEREAAACLIDGLARLCSAGRVLLIPGNHDLAHGTIEASAVTYLARHFGALVVERPGVIEYAGLKFGCLPYPRRGAVRETLDVTGKAGVNEALSQAVNTLALAMRSQGAQVLLAHVSVEGTVPGIQPRPTANDVMLLKATVEAFPCTMLGHIHDGQVVVNGVPDRAAYCGSQVVQDFNEVDEGAQHGGRLWDLLHETGEVMGMEPVAAPMRRKWATLDVEDVTTAADIGALATDGTVYRVRGTLDLERARSLREAIRLQREAGAIIQDDLQIQRIDRARTEEAKGAGTMTDEQILRMAFRLRQVAEERVPSLIDLHTAIAAKGGAL